MGKINIVPEGLTADYLALNPNWHRVIKAKLGKAVSSGLLSFLRSNEAELSELVAEDPNNGYMDLQQLTQGYKVRSKRKKIAVVDADGKKKYNGWHDSIEGVYRPEFLGQGHMQKNPTIAEKALIAFKDRDEVYIFSEGGSKLMICDISEKECTLYGAPFDEVHPFDMIIPVYNTIFQQTQESYIFEAPQIALEGAAKLILGRKRDKWMLNNIFGETFAESEDKGLLQNIVMATPMQIEGLEFYAIEPAKNKAL